MLKVFANYGDLSAGLPPRALQVLIARMLSSELLSRVVDECLQLHGGYGYMWEYPVARAYADSRINRIYGGTTEIMKLIIARELLAR